MTRHFIKRVYRPGFEALEHKQLLSAVDPTFGAMALVHATTPAPAQGEHLNVRPCGTGKGLIIITS
jgi:hypothetical protein